MDIVRRMKTTSKMPILEEAIKESGLLFRHDIVSKVKRHKIPDALILNLDQAPSKYATVAQTTLAKKNSKSVVIAGESDKHSITATFAVPFDGTFLPMHLIYGRKTTQSLPKFKCRSSFSLSVNPTHNSNENEACKIVEEIIALYVKNVRKRDKLPVDQKVLLIMDVFSGQVTQAVLDILQKEDILLSRVPAGMTPIYQILDLTVNGYAKRFMKKKFHEWYTNQVQQQLDEGKEVKQIEVKLTLTNLKLIHAKWLVDFYNHMTTPEGK